MEKKNLKNKSVWVMSKKFLSVLLAAVMFFNVVYIPAPVLAASSASDTTYVVQEGINISSVKTLTDLGNNLYRLSFRSSSSVKNTNYTTSREYSHDDYFVADTAGYYLVELWGGNGGNGGDTYYVENTGGSGGNGGYVYGYVWLDQGDTLVFTIGTNGTSASAIDVGGGENGNGGEHGEEGSVVVGTGGGFSAVYLFNETRNSISFTGAERLSNYIMIAGGGGGGGGNTSLYTPDYRPNGGIGGSVDSSVSGHLDANDNNGVAGTFFRGANGQSTSTIYSYVGRGGSSVPGAVVTTLYGKYSTETPNDWTGTYNTALSYGAGGNGNFRGGGGGAGFCGGSGGIQRAQLLPDDIGGGGGGSSFIADTVTYKNLSSRVRSYLHGAENNVNRTETGGACVISYLGNTANDVTDTSHLESVVLRGTVSTYFDIVDVQTYGNGTKSVSGSSLVVSGINIAPAEDGYEGSVSQIDVYLRPKDEFAGGNGVPVIGTQFSLTPNGKSAIMIKENDSTDYCNVPLNFKIPTESFMVMADELPKSYSVSSLYTDSYSSVRDDLSSNWQYKYIDVIDDIYVYNESGASVSGTITISSKTEKTYLYDVTMKVEPNTDRIAAVGESVSDTTIKNIASISVVPTDAAGTVNSINIDATKTLSGDGSSYQSMLNVNQKTSNEVFVKSTNMLSNTSGEGEWTPLETGWYFIQAWGGNGGGAGSSVVNQKLMTYTPAASASGGAGGYVYGYVFLTAGQTIYYNVGSAGAYGAGGGTKTLSSVSDYKTSIGNGGGGGSYTSISLSKDSDYLLIAGGGGGAGGSAAAARGAIGLITGLSSSYHKEKDATAGKASTTIVTSFSDIDDFFGKKGTDGSASANSSSTSASPGTAGNGGSNYRPSNMLTGYDTTGGNNTISGVAKSYASSIKSSKDVSGGQVNFTLIETPESKAELEKIYGFEASGSFSQYFTLGSITLKTNKTSTSSTKVNNSDGSSTVTYKNGTDVVAVFTYKIQVDSNNVTHWEIYDTDYIPNIVFTEGNEGGASGYYTTYSSTLNFTFNLTPRSGFLGGNDVPLLKYGTESSDDTGMWVGHGDEGFWLSKRDQRDYVNVPVSYTFSDDGFVSQNKTIVCGESVDQAELIVTDEIQLPAGTGAWKADFVKVEHAVTEIVTPKETTTYTFTQKVLPKAKAEKAVIVPDVQAVENTVRATVFVEYSVDTSGLVHIEYEGDKLIADGNDLSAVLKTEHGYDAPSEIIVKIGSQTLDKAYYDYDPETGSLFVESEYISDNIILSGTASPKEYTLHYVYPEINPDGSYVIDSQGNIITKEYSEKYIADEAIDMSWVNSFVAPEKTGHKFFWDWQTEDGSPIEVMPAQDWFVQGYYAANRYSLTVNYYLKGTNEKITESYTEELLYEEEYAVKSPAIEGYTPQLASVSGIIKENTVIDVYYTPNDGILTVFYIYADSNTEAFERLVIDNVATGEEYTVTGGEIPSITGCTPDQTSVTVKMPATGGVNVYINYVPNVYNVTFDAGEGSLAQGEENAKVVFNNIYGYDPDKNSFGELPQPLRNGYEFGGWRNSEGELITESTKVEYAGDHTLTADWKSYSFNLTVYYQYSDGSEAKPTFSATYNYGEAYEVSTPEIIGYTPDISNVNGTMGAGNRVVYVIYKIDSHSLTIYYKDSNGNTIAEDYYAELEYNSEYSVSSPEIPGYIADTTVVSGTMGTNDVVKTVRYSYIRYTLTINYIINEGEAQQPDSYVMKDMHIGEEYEILSPIIDGYTADLPTVSGTFGTSDIIVTVSYSLNSHTLTINYLYDESVEDTSLAGTAAAESYVGTLKYGSAYSVESPVIDGYKLIADVVSGTMPDRDKTINVYYYDQDIVVSVTVEWGALNYNYSESVWNAEQHKYFIPPYGDVWDNTVLVTNNDDSDISVKAELTYSSAEGFESVGAYFTKTDDSDAEKYTIASENIIVGGNAEFWIWLEGCMPDMEYSEEMQNIGSCIVKIGGAD